MALMGNRKEPQEYKTAPAYLVKADEAQGVVEHIITIFGVLDSGGDISHPGSFTKTLGERGQKVRVLDMHRTDSVLRIVGKPLKMREVGRAELPARVLAEHPETTGGLWAMTQFFMDTPEGKGAFVRAREDAVDWSYGYDALDFDYSEEEKGEDKVRVRNLRTVRLWEYGPVLWGMVPGTTTVSAKGEDGPTEGKPAPEETENTIRIRMRDPEDFQDGSFRTINIGPEDNGIQAVVGRLEGETTMTVQSYVFDKEKWTAGEAQEWVDEHKKDDLPEPDEKGDGGELDEKAPTGKADWPLASRDRAWDNNAAEGRIRAWAEAEEGPNEKYRSCHFWYDTENADNFTAYKLLFCDVVDGQARAIPRGIFAVAAVLQGARGGAAIPAADQAAIKGKVGHYYAKMREEFDDDSIAPPWEGKALNLSRQLDSIRTAFDNQYNPPQGPYDWWVRDIYDEYIIVQNDGVQYFQIPYKLEDDGPEFAPRADWTEGEYEFTPVGKGGARAMLHEAMAEMEKMLMREDKAGRILAERNATRIVNALTALIATLEDAGIDIPGFGKRGSDEEEAGPEEPPEKGDRPPTSVKADDRLRNQAKILELEMEMELMTTEV
jgi:hypothetical protein